MRLQSLTHLLEAVQAVARPGKVFGFGSSSLWPQHPELGAVGCPLELTTDADLLLVPINASLAETLAVAVGRDSAFMQEFGYYADILHPDFPETLPAGWETRLHPVPDHDNVFALDPYDLALVKLIVARPKDLDLLRALRRLRLVEPAACAGIIRRRRWASAKPTPPDETSARCCGKPGWTEPPRRIACFDPADR